MIDASNLQSECSRRMKKMQPGEVMRVRTWKNDRGITITCTGSEHFSIAEDGFQHQMLDAPSLAAALKVLKPIARREFPRSNKLRLTLTKEEASWTN